MDSLVERRAPDRALAAVLGSVRHGLDVAAGAECAARTGQYNAAHVVIDLELGQDPSKRLGHRPRQCVAALRTVHRQHRDPLIDPTQQVRRAGIHFRHRELLARPDMQAASRVP